MTETAIVEVWEYEEYDRKRWDADPNHPWTNKLFENCKPPDEMSLPSIEWSWSANWKIDKKPGVTDAQGWEYARSFARFQDANRKPKVEKSWSDKSRRRMWSRMMRKDLNTSCRSPSQDITKTLPRIQQGLSSIHKARLRIEEIMKEAPDAVSTDQMQVLVQSVKKNIADILTAIEQAETNQQKQAGASSHTAVIKKLKNDLMKEEVAIEKALDPALIVLDKRGSKKLPDSQRRPISFNSTSNSNINHPISNSNANNTSSNNISINKSVRDNPDNETMSKNNSNSNADNSLKSLISPTTIASTASTNNNIGLSSSSSKSNVTGGSAKAFNSNALASSFSSKGGGGVSGFFNSSRGSGDDWIAPEEGVFVDRTMQERLIEQKLRPVDEATVMQEIIDERTAEITKVHRGIVEVQEMFRDLSNLVKEQQIEIDKIYDNVDTSHQKTKEAFQNIVAADQLQRSGNCIIS